MAVLRTVAVATKWHHANHRAVAFTLRRHCYVVANGSGRGYGRHIEVIRDGSRQENEDDAYANHVIARALFARRQCRHINRASRSRTNAVCRNIVVRRRMAGSAAERTWMNKSAHAKNERVYMSCDKATRVACARPARGTCAAIWLTRLQRGYNHVMRGIQCRQTASVNYRCPERAKSSWMRTVVVTANGVEFTRRGANQVILRERQ